MTTDAPLQQCRCTMQIKKMSDLLQDRVVKSLVALLKPADRDIPKHGSQGNVTKCTVFVKRSVGTCPPTFESPCVYNPLIYGGNDSMSVCRPRFPSKIHSTGLLLKWVMLVKARARSHTAEEKAQLETDREGSVETITTTRRGSGQV